MKQNGTISKATIDRLPVYFRALSRLKEEGSEIISSDELGKMIGVTPEQIRKDLASFGEFGKKGVGYYVGSLVGHIGEILGLHHSWKVALVGSGHLGWALANYKNFSSLGFSIRAIFDNDPGKVGQLVGGVVVQDIAQLEEVIRERSIQIGIITVPTQDAQEIADRLVEAGVEGIWNFAPTKLNVPDHVSLASEDLAVGLSSLSFHLSRKIKKE